jgi:hypothetical protein
MADQGQQAAELVLERQEAAPAAVSAVAQVVDQHPVLVGTAVLAVLAYAVYHLVGTRSSDKEAETSGFVETPSDRNKGTEDGEE